MREARKPTDPDVAIPALQAILPVVGEMDGFEHRAWSIGFATVAAAHWQIRARLHQIFGTGPGVFWLSVRRASLDHILDHFIIHRNPGYRYPQLAPVLAGGNTLYVGHTANLEARLLEHLTHAHAQLERLHLDTWARCVQGILCVNAAKCSQMDEATRGAMSSQFQRRLTPMFLSVAER